MKVFNIGLGSTMIVKGLDPFKMAGQKLLPYDTFHELQTRHGRLYVNGKEVKGAVEDQKLRIDFYVGKADNPKVNGIMLVDGGFDKTHKASFENY